MQLRPYQINAIQSLREGFAAGYKRQMLQSATGSGKTLTALSMVMSAVAKGRRVLFVCNRKALVNQASTVFGGYGVEHGIVQSDNTRDLHHKVIIASIQSLKTRGVPDDVGLIIWDEAHFVAGSTLALQIIERHNLVPMIGLSATPFSKGLGRVYKSLRGPLFQNMVSAASIRDLIEMGFLVDVDIYAPSEPDMSSYKLRKCADGVDYSDADAAKAADTPKLVGDIVEHWTNLAFGSPTVVFASSVAHSKHIVESFQRSGVSAEHIDAYTEDEDRRDIFDRFNDGRITVLSNVGVLCEGWDAPHCKTMILARPTRSLIRYIQMAGRVLRPFEGVTKALILDHSGTVKNLGFPTDDLPMELDDGKPKTSASVEAKGKPEALPKACPECHFMKPPKTPKCPACGYVAQYLQDIETAAGSLVLVKGKQVPTMADKQQEYSEMLGYAKSKGFNPGWAYHLFNTKHGHYPSNKLKKVPLPVSDKMFSWIKSDQIRKAKARAKQSA